MAKYLFVYHGGKPPSDPTEIKAQMDAWGAWFGSLGAAVIDGGNPVGKSSTVTSPRVRILVASIEPGYS